MVTTVNSTLWKSGGSRGLSALVLLNVVTACAFGSDRRNPYTCEGVARAQGSSLTLEALRKEADASADQAEKTKSAIGYCTAAELYKRLGDPKASHFYERAITAGPDEPAFELLYGDYLRLYRGAGQRPLFQEAEKHLFAARGKLAALQQKESWDKPTEERIQRSLTALYERDGFQLAGWTWNGDGSRAAVSRPWLFFSPGMRWEQGNNDFDRTSDIRDRTSEAAFSASTSRLNRPLTPPETNGLVRLMAPLEGSGRLRIRYRSAPIIDFFATRRQTGDAQVTDSKQPNRFNDLQLIDAGVSIEKPFAISGNTDAVARFAYRRINREGLIESLSEATERISQYEASGALSKYLGPDRLNLSYTYIRQNIDPEPTNLQRRDREIMGGTASYQIFRPMPLPGRNLETGLGRRFETRGIDLLGGVLNDDERYPDSPADVFVTRRDYFAGVAARGLKRVDVILQPTWFTSRVSNDPKQYNSQLRTQGNVLFRILDEERSGGIPKEKLLGLPVAFVHVVVPFHWDAPRAGSQDFRSRKLGVELWAKCFTVDSGVSILGVAGYSRQWFPALRHDLNLLRFGIGVGF